MGQILCQVRIPHRNLLGSDDVVNTFNFTGVDNVEDQATQALGMLKVFYNDLTGLQAVAVKNWMSGELDFAATRIKVYDHADPEPRVPILDESLGVSANSPSASTNLPGEVSVAISYAAELESGEVQRRRRGRIFLGPLNTGISNSTGTTSARPSGPAQTALAIAAGELASGPLGTRWAVWSRANDAFYPIVGGYVDNSFDTQRRRGVATTTRVAFTGGLG